MNSIEIYKLYLKNNCKICIDTRSEKIKDSIFFAIKGQNFDGNDFIQEAINKGASYTIVDKNTSHQHKCIIKVENSLKTLQEISKIHREYYNIPVIGITGSNGKTTTKNILTHILSSKYKVLSTKGNLNNHIGVPITLLSIKKTHELAIIEMGANHTGEINQLCKIAKPTHGIITNIGDAHIGEFGSFNNIIQAKSELFNYLKNNKGYIIYNEDDHILKNLVNNYSLALTYKIPFFEKEKLNNKNNNYKYNCNPFINIHNIKLINTEMIKTKIIGNYNINNIIASLTIANIFKVSNQNIQKALQSIELDNNRSQFIQTKKNDIILDAYNANPTSMTSGIQNFIDVFQFFRYQNKLLILGDMLELGGNKLKYHQEIIDFIQSKNITKCILVGEIFNSTKAHNNYLYVNSIEDCLILLKKMNINKHSIFIKGSRSLKMEKTLEYL
ncbi:MAG: UDP-N-acetylmuramoyl-tripeptide--D-alanyl-D-alanine ligase [Flavobacteriales bacterium]|nr:UDP-N-acetylmuramoyl-tripeptide--D-alanyl-D-alanine ligase [Flavobacteriales bacterium]|tara:strand:+ start:2127 stop:3455 length:1329 start_codon:yes stop_codon:yes gene_type:complete